MECPRCSGPTRRFGFNRNGSQRYRCDACERTYTDEGTRPVDRRELAPAKLVFCLRLLLEGTSIRSVERLTGVHRDTIISAMVACGQRCQGWMEQTIKDVYVEDVQADEVWGYVYAKNRTCERRGFSEERGDAYCFTALERNTKLLLCWHLGKRCPADTGEFALKLSRATNGRFQLTTDGYTPYLTAIPTVFGNQIDYGTLVKIYGETEEAQRRYSPPRIMEVVATPQIGNPDPDAICTSHVERSNLTIRMQIRRMTRLTNAFSKRWSNHEAALALFFAFYNFVRPHMTLSKDAGYKCTPAMKAGLAQDVWTLDELLRNVRSIW